LNDTRDINIIGKIIQTSLAKDKLHGHYDNLNSWLEESGLSSIEDIMYSEDLQKRYAKLLLVIYNRSEKTALIGTGESYILRILEALGDDIRDSKYPKLGKTFIKDHIDYYDNDDTTVVKEHYSFYKKRLSIIVSDDTSMNEARKELEKEIEGIVSSNFSATSIYTLFGNTKIKTFLESRGYESVLLPTIAEFKDTGFRELFFDYATPVHGRIPPQIYNLELILAGGAVGAGGVLLGVATLVRRLLKRIRKNKPQEDKPQENRDGLKRFITQVLEKI
ncbi:MAG: hypothetical protein Q8K26_03565, partial [Candidatus Gracilibacteria bacterium]|nr:hypothetical protein [Candidatus Gracilibacteria bacterium]